jgi:hypothetical protein
MTLCWVSTPRSSGKIIPPFKILLFSIFGVICNFLLRNRLTESSFLRFLQAWVERAWICFLPHASWVHYVVPACVVLVKAKVINNTDILVVKPRCSVMITKDCYCARTSPQGWTNFFIISLSNIRLPSLHWQLLIMWVFSFLCCWANY